MLFAFPLLLALRFPLGTLALARLLLLGARPLTLFFALGALELALLLLLLALALLPRLRRRRLRSALRPGDAGAGQRRGGGEGEGVFCQSVSDSHGRRLLC